MQPQSRPESGAPHTPSALQRLETTTPQGHCWQSSVAISPVARLRRRTRTQPQSQAESEAQPQPQCPRRPTRTQPQSQGEVHAGDAYLCRPRRRTQPQSRTQQQWRTHPQTAAPTACGPTTRLAAAVPAEQSQQLRLRPCQPSSGHARPPPTKVGQHQPGHATTATAPRPTPALANAAISRR